MTHQPLWIILSSPRKREKRYKRENRGKWDKAENDWNAYEWRNRLKTWPLLPPLPHHSYCFYDCWETQTNKKLKMWFDWYSWRNQKKKKNSGAIEWWYVVVLISSRALSDSYEYPYPFPYITLSVEKYELYQYLLGVPSLKLSFSIFQNDGLLGYMADYVRLTKYWDSKAFANSADPDQMLQNAVSDQGLHCLPYIEWYFSDINT